MSHNISQITQLKLNLTLSLSRGLPVTDVYIVLLCLIKSSIALSTSFITFRYLPSYLRPDLAKASYLSFYDIVVK